MKHTRHGYWLEEAGEVQPLPALERQRSADLVVVGGGYTGMWAAWQVKQLEPDVRVVLLEADLCGHGPSGRNGGFCNVMWFSLPNMRERWGDAAALAVARASQGAVAGIESFCNEQRVDAWFLRGGYLQVSTAPVHDGAWEEALAACRELGEAASGTAARPGKAAPGEVAPTGTASRHGTAARPPGTEPAQALSPAEVAARCASPAFRGGAFFPDAATVQPARLALGLRERLLAAGVEVHERSPVRRLRRVPGGLEAETGAGRLVRAPAAVVAIGGAAKAPHAPLRDSLTVTSSHMVLTEPVPDLLEEIGWTGGECITDSRSLIDYFRTTPDGRIAFGWGGGRIAMGARLHGRAELDPGVVAATGCRLREYFPGLAGRRITHAWGGPIDASPTHLPMVLPLADGRAFAAAGYTGNGVGPSHMVGRVLASLVLDRRDEHTRLPIVDPSPQRVPPEPLQWLGGEAIRCALVRKEEAELSGRTADSVSALVSRIPELIGFHIGR
jgi:glycine/D-amino acid oxidase-like deaminating enzyme